MTFIEVTIGRMALMWMAFGKMIKVRFSIMAFRRMTLVKMTV